MQFPILFLGKSIKAIHLVTLSNIIIFSYWAYFFGDELVSTIHLYKNGNSTYQFLHVTNYTNYSPLPLNSSNAFPVINQPKTTHQQIPLILHRLWRDANIPEHWTQAYDNCNEIYSQRNWTSILWTDGSIRAFMRQHYPTFMPTYESYRYNIQRVDAARYFLLYHYGGVYMDLDIGCQKNRDMSVLVRSIEQSGKGASIPLTYPMGFSNDVLFSSKRHPFFHELIKTLPMRNLWYGSPYLTVMFSTGPMFLSLVYMRMSSVWQNYVLVLPPEMYSVRESSYFRHLRGSTWHQGDAQLVKWIARNWYFLVGFVPATILLCRRKRSLRMGFKVKQ